MYTMIDKKGNSGSLDAGTGTYVWDPETFTLTLTFTSKNYLHGFGGTYAPGFVAPSLDGADTATSVIMTIGKDITYTTEWRGDPLRFKKELYAQSVLLTSPGGNTFKLTVSDDGVLTATALNK